MTSDPSSKCGTPGPLLAKSPDGRLRAEDGTLLGHSIRTMNCAIVLNEILRPSLMWAFGLNPADCKELRRLSVLAALLHDLGKANASFQALVREGSHERHPWRHEFLSAAALYAVEPMQQWLSDGLSPKELGLVSMMIAGHHLRATKSIHEPRAPRDERLMVSDPAVHSVLEHVARALTLSEVPELTDIVLSPEQGTEWMGDYVEFAAEALGTGRVREAILPIGKALVIGADIVASALRPSEPLETWMADALTPGLEASELASVVDSRLQGHGPRPFQVEVSKSADRITVVTAGCGNGKTVAAYMWAQTHAVGRRLAFCYPTTGTATAGFEDYLLAQTELERRLLHSRALVDIEGFARSPDDDTKAPPLDVWARDVLDRWSAQVVACTADTLLGLMVNWRPSVASLPLFTQCALVFDEVHSYDRQLFGALLSFVANTRVPVLIMTASLSPARKAALEDAAGCRIVPIRGDARIENARRYELENVTSRDAEERVLQAVENGLKVLWVNNQVKRAQRVFRRLRTRVANSSCLLYHSRFRYEDRVSRQDEVLRAFRAEGGALVIATQVCEMSLDISADVLATDLAPFPAVVQRLGRLNRRAVEPCQTGACLVLEPDNALPYAADDLEMARSLITRLGEHTPLSQQDLANALETVPEEPYEERSVPFFDQTWETFPTPLREASPTISVVRESELPSDLSKVRSANITRSTIPMPIPPRQDRIDWPRVRGVYVVPDARVSYSLEEGAEWAS